MINLEKQNQTIIESLSSVLIFTICNDSADQRL